MDAKTQDKLELPAIRELLARECACSLGRERAEALKPSSTPQVVADRLAETTEARRVLDTDGAPPFGGISDVRDHLHRARIGSALSATELLAVAACFRGMRRLKEALRECDPDEFTRLAELEDKLAAFPPLERRIDSVIDDDGQVADGASPDLRKLRGRIRSLRERIEERMRSIVASAGMDHVLQDRIVTIRRDRPCVPVKAGSRRSLPGVVHDISSSGATVFVEPDAVVGDGDLLQQTISAEQEEVARILRELSAQVGEVAEEALGSLAAAGILDYVFARGRLSRRMDAVEPVVSPEGRVRLINARHPLIAPDAIVPIDVWVGEEFAVLLITGPNTGGKTVTLKTVGLLALMAQCGMHIPADTGSELPVLKGVYADIGDEQSITQSLSTFSSHIGNIARICKRARQGTLMLLDEIGAGTDPGEGSALAQAILRFLRDRGSLVLTTTHYNSLKTFALSEPGIENASVEFDPDTLAPTYRLRIGVPGSSNALAIASRLGLNSDVLKAAKELIGDDAVRVERVVSDLERSRRRYERDRLDLQRETSESARVRVALTREREELVAERERLRREGITEATELVRLAQEEAQEALRDLRAQQQEGRGTQAARDKLKSLESLVRERAQELEPNVEPEPLPEVREGDSVRVGSLGGKRGVVVDEPKGGKVRVSTGGLQVEVDLADLEVLEGTSDRDLRDQVGVIKVRKALSVPTQLDLRGMTVDEALDVIDKFLDDAALAEHERVMLLHGKGTGALREGVRRHLRQLPVVKEFHDAPLNEGGDGVTVVKL